MKTPADSEAVWETCKELRERVAPHLSPAGFSARLKAFKGEYPARRGAKRRTRFIQATEDMEAWLGEKKKQGSKGGRKTVQIDLSLEVLEMVRQPGQEIPIDVIADICGVSRSAIWQSYRRGMKKLRAAARRLEAA